MGDGALSLAGRKRIERVLSGAVHADRRGVPGLIAMVCRRGAVDVFEHGWMAFEGDTRTKRDMTRGCIFRIASMTKPVTAVAAMILVEECRLRLDDPVDRLLPELANRQVLRRPDAPLDDTEPAKRSITVRDLLTFTMGLGEVSGPDAKNYPISKAIARLYPGQYGPNVHPDQWMHLFDTVPVPLVHQPGQRWMYHMSADVLGVLIARVVQGIPGPASQKTYAGFLKERVFQPLGMQDTGYWVTPEKLDRIPTSYSSNLQPWESWDWTKQPVFVSGAGVPSLLSTADDYARFLRMLLNKGRYGDGRRILSRASVELITTDQLTDKQKIGNESYLGSGGWGFGLAVNGHRDDLATRPGRFGWAGGLGTDAWADPSEDLIGILLTQVAFGSPVQPTLFPDFWTAVYAAIDD